MNTYILGIDPGSEKSGYVLLSIEKITNYINFTIIEKDHLDNTNILNLLVGKKIIYQYMREKSKLDVAIETIESRGMNIGQSTIDTSIWAGRFYQKAEDLNYNNYELITRRNIKLNICEDSRAKPKNIRQALKDRFGDYGTKKNPGKLYNLKGAPKGSSDHIWSALAVCITYIDKNYGECK